MIYHKEDYQRESSLVRLRINKTALDRKYPKQYVKMANEAIDKMFAIFDFQPNQALLSHPMVIEAFELAQRCHEGQERKYTKEAYLVHLREVASMVSSLENATHHEVVVALLHDVVEKGNVSLPYIKQKFGQAVHDDVDYLSDKPLDGLNRKDRILANFTRFMQSSRSAHIVKVADILSNTRSIVLCDAKYGQTYSEPIFQYMNPYFQQSPHVPRHLKLVFQSMCDLSQELIDIQEKLGVHKLEKQYANAQKSLKRRGMM